MFTIEFSMIEILAFSVIVYAIIGIIVMTFMESENAVAGFGQKMSSIKFSEILIAIIIWPVIIVSATYITQCLIVPLLEKW